MNYRTFMFRDVVDTGTGLAGLLVKLGKVVVLVTKVVVSKLAEQVLLGLLGSRLERQLLKSGPGERPCSDPGVHHSGQFLLVRTGWG